MIAWLISLPQHQFLAILLLLAAGLGSGLQAKAQQAYDVNSVNGYSCSDAGKTSCRTFVLYRAQVRYSNLSKIAELFNENASAVATFNKLSANQTLDVGEAVILPVNCSCEDKITSARISYTVEAGDSFWEINLKNFESLSTMQAIKAANNVNPTALQPGQEIVIPVRCACPSMAQSSEGVKSLVTYPVVYGDSVIEIASNFNVSSAEIISANTLMKTNPRIIEETTLVIPIKSDQSIYLPDKTLSIEPFESPDLFYPSPPSDGGGGMGTANSLYLFIGVFGGLGILIVTLWFRSSERMVGRRVKPSIKQPFAGEPSSPRIDVTA